MKRATLWPLSIVVCLGALMVLYAYLFHVAGDPAALVVEKDYYQKGLHYSDEMAQQRLNSSLGWTVSPMISALPAGGADLRVEVRDAAGAPLSGATVDVVATHNVIANAPETASLADRGNGSYDAHLSLPRAGMWELRFVVVHGGQKFTADERVDIPRALASR